MLFIGEKCTCGQRMDKNANVCPQCGQPREGAWRSCHDCGAAVGAQAKKCWKCRADLTAQPVQALYGDRWRREPGDFAVRFPLRVPAGVVKHGVQVEAGTKAFLMVNGKHDDALGPGYHVMSSCFERLTGIHKMSQHVEALLVSAGPSMVKFPVSGLRDAQQVPMEADITVELWLDEPEKFIERAMPGKQVFAGDDFRGLLGGDVRQAVATRAAQYRIESLLSDMSQREGLEAVLGEEMPRILEPYGLKFSGVRLAEFGGAEVEGIRKKLGAKAITERQLKIQQEIDGLLREQEISNMEGEAQVTAVRARLEHDLGLQQDEMTFVRKQLRQRAEHTLRLELLKQGLAEAEIEEKIKDLRASAEQDRNKEKFKLASEAQKAALDALERMKRMETENALTMAQGLKDCAPAAIVAAMAGYPAVGQSLVALGAVQRGLVPGFGNSPAWPMPGAVPVSMPSPMFGNPYPASRPQGGMGGYGMGGYGMGGGHFAWRPGFFATGSSVPNDPRQRSLVEQAISAVGVVRLVCGDGKRTATGTAWMLGPNVMVTNAHVARAVVDGVQKDDVSCWVGFCDDAGPREARVERVVMHPKYGNPGPGPRGETPTVPAYDVALLVLDSPQPVLLPVAEPACLLNLAIGDRVMYLGFPNEGLAGPGVNDSRPAPIFKQGAVSQLTDWWSGKAPFEQSLLIHHDLGVAGGASGSPLFDVNGQVVGIVCAGNMSATVDAASGGLQRIPSGVLINYAQRVDVLGELFERIDPMQATP